MANYSYFSIRVSCLYENEELYYVIDGKRDNSLTVKILRKNVVLQDVLDVLNKKLKQNQKVVKFFIDDQKTAIHLTAIIEITK